VIDVEKYREIEKSIIKKFRKDIWSKFVKAIKDYRLINEFDKIAVCISGGKDSMLMAKCMQELQRHGQIKFDLEFLVMDPGYNEINKDLIISNAKELNIPITLFETNIYDSVASINEGSPCYLCARMRRGHLYNKAKELGCNKIALGHHFDDVIETVLLNMLYAGEIKTMMPKLHSTNYEGLELIRPMYLIKEEAIIAWKKTNDLHFINCACRFTENCSINDDSGSKRKEMKNLINNFRKTNPYIDMNIFKSVENVNLNTIIGYHKDNKSHHFLDEYNCQNDKNVL
jgi:tRNA 2-thiocytidine biosynthesis protein TtcA